MNIFRYYIINSTKTLYIEQNRIFFIQVVFFRFWDYILTYFYSGFLKSSPNAD